MRIKIKRSYVIIALLGIVAVVVASYFVAPPFLFGSKEIKNISYVPGDDSPSHKMDLFVPEHKKLFEGPRPLIIWIHGGAWEMGDKEGGAARLFPLFGFVGASINYRLTDQARFPAQIEDCRSAVTFLRTHAEEYGIDPERIGVWGLSAGGQLALLLGMAPSHLFEPGTIIEPPSHRVQAVCDWSGPTDFKTITKQSKPGDKLKLDSPTGPVAKLLGGLPDELGDSLMIKQASPVTFAKAGLPPIYIVHGELDEVVPREQSEELAKLLTKFSVPNTLTIVPGAKHELTDSNLIRSSVEFFERELKPAR